MAVEDNDDRATFFETGEFAVAVTYRDSEGYAKTGTFATSTVNGIFGNAFAEFGGVETQKPAFTCVASDVPDPKHGDEFDIQVDGETVTFKFVGVQPDGAGIVTILLERKNA